MDRPLIPVFDGHNDLLFRLLTHPGANPAATFADGDGAGHLDLERARRGGFVGGLFAAFVPPSRVKNPAELTATPDEAVAGSDKPHLPPPLDRGQAQAATIKMASLLLRIEQRIPNAFKLCRTVEDIRSAMATRAIAAVFHIEGAEAIDPDFHMLDLLHAAGLRSLGIVWSRPTIFGHGVPFRFNSTPDIGPGLTDLGKELVRRCNAKRIMIDLSHLNEAGFWDVAKLSKAPLVATHSNVHMICPHARNLTEAQLAAIRASRGMVGVNFATAFLRPDGKTDTNTPLDDVLRHLDALIDALGEDGVGFGSDFDGAAIPAAIGDVAGLPALIAACRRHGYGEALLRKLAYENWLRTLDASWKPIPTTTTT